MAGSVTRRSAIHYAPYIHRFRGMLNMFFPVSMRSLKSPLRNKSSLRRRQYANWHGVNCAIPLDRPSKKSGFRSVHSFNIRSFDPVTLVLALLALTTSYLPPRNMDSGTKVGKPPVFSLSISLFLSTCSITHDGGIVLHAA
jgi:hypothetical protein